MCVRYLDYYGLNHRQSLMSYRGGEVRLFEPVVRMVDTAAPLDSLLPQFDPLRRLVLLFDKGGHVDFHFNGIHYEPMGPIGGEIRVIRRFGHQANEHRLLVIIHDLSPEMIERLLKFEEEFQAETRKTCIAAGCAQFEPLLPEIFQGAMLAPADLIESLIAAQQSGMPIEFARIDPGGTTEAAIRDLTKMKAHKFMIHYLLKTVRSSIFGNYVPF